MHFNQSACRIVTQIQCARRHLNDHNRIELITAYKTILISMRKPSVICGYVLHTHRQWIKPITLVLDNARYPITCMQIVREFAERLQILELTLSSALLLHKLESELNSAL